MARIGSRCFAAPAQSRCREKSETKEAGCRKSAEAGRIAEGIARVCRNGGGLRLQAGNRGARAVDNGVNDRTTELKAQWRSGRPAESR